MIQPKQIAGGGGPLPQASRELYVNKGGSDITGTGSVTQPFLTIAHAIAVVNGFADASTTKRYLILLGPGDWSDPIVLPAWVWIVGNGDVIATRLNGAVCRLFTACQRYRVRWRRRFAIRPLIPCAVLQSGSDSPFRSRCQLTPA